MNNYLHKSNLICLSQIKDWENIILDVHNNIITIDERYFQSVRPGYQLDIKKLYSLLRTNFYHYYILIDFPIKNLTDNEITNVNSEIINFLEIANNGLLKAYNNYYYYKHPDAHLLKELNLKNSIIINNYKNEYQKTELPTHSKSLSIFFKKKNSFMDKEINDEYKFNMKSLFDFGKMNIFGITKLETIKEPEESNNKKIINLENHNIDDIVGDISNFNADNFNNNKIVVSKNINTDNHIDTNNSNCDSGSDVDGNGDSDSNSDSDSDSDVDVDVDVDVDCDGNSDGNGKNELKKSKTIIDIEPSKNDINNIDSSKNNTSNNNSNYNANNGNENNTTTNCGINQQDYNARYEQLSFTETCMYKAMNFYTEVSNFFFSVKQTVIINFNYYFRTNNTLFG